jgi:hypothetical protein
MDSISVHKKLILLPVNLVCTKTTDLVPLPSDGAMRFNPNN